MSAGNGIRLSSRQMWMASRGGSSERREFSVLFSSVLFLSVFFPSVGRRRNKDGGLEYAGQTGYYHTASIAASSSEDPHAVWSMFLGKWPNPGLMYQLPTFGQSIRCVKD